MNRSNVNCNDISTINSCRRQVDSLLRVEDKLLNKLQAQLLPNCKLNSTNANVVSLSPYLNQNAVLNEEYNLIQRNQKFKKISRDNGSRQCKYNIREKRRENEILEYLDINAFPISKSNHSNDKAELCDFDDSFLDCSSTNLVTSSNDFNNNTNVVFEDDRNSYYMEYQNNTSYMISKKSLRNTGSHQSSNSCNSSVFKCNEKNEHVIKRENLFTYINSLKTQIYTIEDYYKIKNERIQKINNYLKKKHKRTGRKFIRYHSRKAYADKCPRIKGRFAKLDQVKAINAIKND